MFGDFLLLCFLSFTVNSKMHMPFFWKGATWNSYVSLYLPSLCILKRAVSHHKYLLQKYTVIFSTASMQLNYLYIVLNK